MPRRDGKLLQFAKSMRQQMTKPEFRLWWHLQRQKDVLGKFRRQEPIDQFIVDFVNYEARLIIEVDGSDHDSEKDSERDSYLISQGFRVLRYSNTTILQETQTVLDSIYAALHPPPHHSLRS